jgi:hypothetical protein
LPQIVRIIVGSGELLKIVMEMIVIIVANDG